MSDLIATLKKLDPSNDSHWTEEGFPRLDVLSKALGRELTREELNAAVPSFSRATAEAFGDSAADDAADGVAPAGAPSNDLPSALESATDGDEPPSLDVLSAEDRDARVASLGEAMAHHVREAARHNQLRDDCQNEIARLSLPAEAESNLPIAEFLASQNKARAERAANAQAIAAAGLDLKAIGLMVQGAPIDAARMSQRNTLRQGAVQK